MTAPSLKRAAPAAWNGDALFGVLDRLEATIDAESSAFRAHQPVDLADINQRKHQGLLELSRIAPTLPADSLDEDLRDRLAVLADKLESNRRLLDVQLRAVREVADIIAATIREAESDGTYSMSVVWP